MYRQAIFKMIFTLIVYQKPKENTFWREMTERNPMSQETKKGASFFCMVRACLKMRPRQVGCEGNGEGERDDTI